MAENYSYLLHLSTNKYFANLDVQTCISFPITVIYLIIKPIKLKKQIKLQMSFKKLIGESSTQSKLYIFIAHSKGVLRFNHHHGTISFCLFGITGIGLLCIGLLLISEKTQLISRDKKTFQKNKFILGYKKHFSTCFFRRPHQLYLMKRSKVFYSQKCIKCFFFISSPLLTFPKIDSMFFFPKCVFFCPPSSDFGFFLI